MKDNTLSQPINAQVKIALSKNDVLFYSTDMEVLRHINADKKLEYSNPITELKVGAVIKTGGNDEYRIINITTLMYDSLEANEGYYGMPMATYGMRYPYNFQIIYTVEQID